jgi:hypothetical protein
MSPVDRLKAAIKQPEASGQKEEARKLREHLAQHQAAANKAQAELQRRGAAERKKRFK